MAIVTQLRRLVFGSLIAASIAKPLERRFDGGDDDDDDTPLPVVIWHGKNVLLRQPRK